MDECNSLQEANFLDMKDGLKILKFSLARRYFLETDIFCNFRKFLS